MKIKTFKTALVLCTLILGMNTSALAQDPKSPVPTEEIQPLMLIENKITFHAQQIDFSSVVIETVDATFETVLPTLTISSDNTTITIDFSACEAGNYIISGTRDELVLQYLIEHKK